MVMTAEKKSKKIYILDTNVLIQDPMAIFSFKGAWIGIPAVVIEECDRLKKEGTDRGRNAREAVRQLDLLRQQGSLSEGVKLDNGATVQVLLPSTSTARIPFSLDKEDNAILQIAYDLKGQGYDVQFISKDLNARVKADALHIISQDYLKEYVSEEEFYKGWLRIQVAPDQLRTGAQSILTDLPKQYDLASNEFVLLENADDPKDFRVFRHKAGAGLAEVVEPTMPWPLHTRNPQQAMALDLMLDSDVQLITLLGPAGTGKTFLTLLAGLYQILIQGTYEKMLIARPIMPLGKDIGYVPGTIEEKLHAWMLPIYDNMEFIIHEVNAHSQFAEREMSYGRRKGKGRKHNREIANSALMPLDELIYQGKVSLEAITYMRGRSIPYQFVLIDEAQNLTPHEIKTLISRAGEGSKIILAGDPYQIDTPYLDFSNNGLVYTSEKFKGQKIFGSVFLEISERSELSKLAGKLL
jgi:PhoH-like ATPase